MEEGKTFIAINSQSLPEDSMEAGEKMYLAQHLADRKCLIKFIS